MRTPETSSKNVSPKNEDESTQALRRKSSSALEPLHVYLPPAGIPLALLLDEEAMERVRRGVMKAEPGIIDDEDPYLY